MTNLAAVGFGTTVIPGIALADPAGNGYVNYIVAHIIAIAGGFFVTLVLGRFMDKDSAEQDVEGKSFSEATKEEEKETLGTKKIVLEQVVDQEVFFGYTEGKQIVIEDVKDETFAGKVLGDGVAVIPSVGKVYAPADGTIVNIFETKHALCFASNHGTEILIHIGVDTVNLKGKYFTAHVKDGDIVKKGQLLITFDKEQIEKAGYDTTIPMIFTDLPDDKRLMKAAPGPMTKNTEIITVSVG